MRCLIIHNPASGPSSDEIYAFTHALAQGGDEVVMRFIGDGMEPEDAVADVREFDRVVVSGGDGTVSNVLDQMRGCGVPTLVFPSGTACLFFNNIGNAPEAAALAKACRAGRTVKIIQTKEAKITCTPSLGMQFDGEIISSNSGVFGARALPQCLDLIVDEFSPLGK